MKRSIIDVRLKILGWTTYPEPVNCEKVPVNS